MQGPANAVTTCQVKAEVPIKEIMRSTGGACAPGAMQAPCGS
jgi:hypothetical protein